MQDRKNKKPNNETVLLKLSDGSKVLMSVDSGDGKPIKHDGPVSAQGLTYAAKKTFAVVKGIAEDISKNIKAAKPHKAKVEFSLELSKKKGDLFSKICDVEGKGGIKITLEWDYTDK